MTKKVLMKAPNGSGTYHLTPAHVAAKQWFLDNGVSVAFWARKNKFPQQLVYEVLKGRSAVRGKSHEIAVALGIKKAGAQ